MKRNEVLARGTAVLICLAAAAGLGACGKKGNLKESVVASLAAEETPDTQIHEGIKLDFDEAQSSTEELVDDYADEYPLNDYIDTYVDEERKIVNLIWPLKDEATEKDGVRYGILLIKLFNDACAQQDFSILYFLQRVDTSKESALAASAGTDDNDHFSFMYCQADILQYRQVIILFFQVADR